MAKLKVDGYRKEKITKDKEFASTIKRIFQKHPYLSHNAQELSGRMVHVFSGAARSRELNPLTSLQIPQVCKLCKKAKMHPRSGTDTNSIRDVSEHLRAG